MMIQAVLGNPNHPEYGVATIPFPIPHDQYAHCMELLEALEIGDAVKTDCKVEKIDSFYTVLKRAEMLTVNVEELNYLAKRLESFDTGEAAQFQAMAHKLELFELKDLINLTFCCQQATVITDFSDLAGVEAVQSLGKVVQLLHIDREHFRAFEHREKAINLLHLAVHLDRVADLQCLQQLHAVCVLVMWDGERNGCNTVFRVVWIAEYSMYYHIFASLISVLRHFPSPCQQIKPCAG